MGASFLEEKLSFKMLGLIFSCTLDYGSCIAPNAETDSKKIGVLIHCVKFLSHKYAWNIVAMSGLVLLAANWMF